MILSGVNFPQDGNFIYKENLDFEQNAIHNEIINRDKDAFGVGIHSGGSISIEGLSIRISPMIAYDSLGKRIQTSESVLSSIPTGESVLVVRHSFVLSESNPDLLENAITHKSNSFEFFFRSSLLENDVALYRIRKNSIVEILEDLRSFRSINAVNIAPDSIDNSKLASDIKVGSLNSIASKILSKFSVGEVRDIVKSLNYLLAIVDEQDGSLQSQLESEADTRSQADSDLQSNINAKANKSGDTFTGNIVIPPATAANHAVNKSQLDPLSTAITSHSDQLNSIAGNKRIINDSSPGNTIALIWSAEAKPFMRVDNAIFELATKGQLDALQADKKINGYHVEDSQRITSLHLDPQSFFAYTFKANDTTSLIPVFTNNSSTNNNWCKLGSLLIQWGSLNLGNVSGDKGFNVVLPVTYPNTYYSRQFSLGNIGSDPNGVLRAKVDGSINVTGHAFTVMVSDSTATNQAGLFLSWFTIGFV